MDDMFTVGDHSLDRRKSRLPRKYAIPVGFNDTGHTRRHAIIRTGQPSSMEIPFNHGEKHTIRDGTARKSSSVVKQSITSVPSNDLQRSTLKRSISVPDESKRSNTVHTYVRDYSNTNRSREDIDQPSVRHKSSSSILNFMNAYKPQLVTIF